MPISLHNIAIADRLLASGIEDGLYTHAVYGLSVQGMTAASKAFGAATLETVFDLASLTKPIATATLLMQLLERGKLHLLLSVRKYFEPDYHPLPHLSDINLFHLVTHTSGVPPVPQWPDGGHGASRSELIHSVVTTPLLRGPDIGYTYSDTGYIMLGEIIAKVSGKGLDELFREYVAEPLELEQLSFIPSMEFRPMIAPTGKGIAPGIVHDPRCRDLGGIAGHAGMFGTMPDVLRFAETIRQGGQPILSRASAARMSVNQIDPRIGSHSLGWFCPGNDYLPKGDLFSNRSFGHSGFTGTLILIDPEYQVSLVLLTNRVVNETEDGSRFLKLRRLWLNAMAASII